MIIDDYPDIARRLRGDDWWQPKKEIVAPAEINDHRQSYEAMCQATWDLAKAALLGRLHKTLVLVDNPKKPPRLVYCTDLNDPIGTEVEMH